MEKCTCWKEMKNLWNIDCVIYTSYPAQWDDTYICETCKTTRKVREHWQVAENIDLKGFRNI